MNRLLIVALLLLSLTPAALCEEGVLVTLKLTKTDNAPAAVATKIGFSSACTTCSVVDDQAYARQNAREVILAIRIPRSQPIDLKIATDTSAFRRVTLETVDLPFSKDFGNLRFIVPAQIADRVNSGEFQTHLYWPGIELRLEHGDPTRRAGDYATGDFPSLQRQAASNLEFGLLEAIKRLGLDHYVDDQNLGKLFIMGFDTNFPHGHHDSPAHFHLALWLPNYRGGGSLIPHFYLSPKGRIVNSLVMPYDWPLKAAEYKAGEPFTASDMLTRPVYSMTITPEGWLNLTRFDGQKCSLKPIGDGFDSGIEIRCPSFPPMSIKVEDDIEHGQIREVIDGRRTQVFHYDPDTGAAL